MEIQPGHTIDNYIIQSLIAQGAYSNVYKASHAVLTKRIVALKLLHTPFTDTNKSQEAFYQEARILDQIQHPHILAVLDVGSYQGLPYIVKEFAPHGSLLDKLHKLHGRPMPLDDALPVLRQVGDGLQFAHQHRVVHCDLKPANILFNAQDEALISDFDIARVVHSVKSSIAVIGGTPSYMAPEHFQGKVRCESDQYSLGCMTYELLTGRRPFEAKSYDELRQLHIHQNPAPPSQYNSHLPQHIEQAILKAMSKKVDDRYPDVFSYIRALDAAQDTVIVRSAPHEPLSLSRTVKPGAKLVLKGDRNSVDVGDNIFYEPTIVGENAFSAPEHDEVKLHPSRKHSSASLNEEKTLPVKPVASHKLSGVKAITTPEKSGSKKKPATASTVEKTSSSTRLRSKSAEFEGMKATAKPVHTKSEAAKVSKPKTLAKVAQKRSLPAKKEVSAELSTPPKHTTKSTKKTSSDK